MTASGAKKLSEDWAYIIPPVGKCNTNKSSQQDWNAELDRKLGEYFGSHIYVRLREGYISDLIDLRMCLTEREHEFIITQLRQACLDYERYLQQGWDDNIIIGHYPKKLKIETGNKGQEKRQCLIQIFV